MGKEFAQEVLRVRGVRGPAVCGGGRESDIEVLARADQGVAEIYNGLEGHHLVLHAVDQEQGVFELGGVLDGVVAEGVRGVRGRRAVLGQRRGGSVAAGWWGAWMGWSNGRGGCSGMFFDGWGS